MAIVEAKRKRTKPDLEVESTPQSAQVVDLMERLRQSLGTRRPARARTPAKKAAKAGGRKKPAAGGRRKGTATKRRAAA